MEREVCENYARSLPALLRSESDVPARQTVFGRGFAQGDLAVGTTLHPQITTAIGVSSRGST